MRFVYQIVYIWDFSLDKCRDTILQQYYMEHFRSVAILSSKFSDWEALHAEEQDTVSNLYTLGHESNESKGWPALPKPTSVMVPLLRQYPLLTQNEKGIVIYASDIVQDMPTAHWSSWKYYEAMLM